MAVMISNTTRRRVDITCIRQAVETTLRFFRQKGDVSVVIIGARRMRSLNRMYRGRDAVTDVLSFTENESEVATPNFLGELFINYETIKQQAKKFSPSVRFELAFITIHGTLHLLGYEDKTSAGVKKMEQLGEKIIKKISI